MVITIKEKNIEIHKNRKKYKGFHQSSIMPSEAGKSLSLVSLHKIFYELKKKILAV